ncbi:MAG: hypothetical protein PHH26_08165 [Candidatus Thermoplasmatota archaeon]|nr:hypothetical protein [Candidatus Thermoplasmatota archaeon]
MSPGKSESGFRRAMRAFLSSAHDAFQSARSSPIFSLLVLGFCLRLALAPFLTWTFDASFWYKSATDFMSGVGIYNSDTFSYPPLWAYTFLPFVWLLSLIVPPSYFGTYSEQFAAALPNMYMMVPTVTSPLFNLAFKLPLMIADALVGVMIYKVALGFTSEGNAKKAFLMWYFNPILILCSTIFGQFDVLPAMMAFLGVLLAYKKEYLFSGLSIGIGFLYKVWPAFLGPLLALFAAGILVGEYRKNALLKSEAAGNGTNLPGKIGFSWCKMLVGFVLPSTIFLLCQLKNGIITKVFELRVKYETVNGMNVWFWGIVPKFSGFALNLWENFHTPIMIVEILAILAIAIFAFFAIQSGKTPAPQSFRVLLVCAVTSIATILLVSQKTNPDYLVWLLPFIIIESAAFGNFRKYVAPLAIFGSLYYLSMAAIGLISTFAVYTNFISPETIAKIYAAYLSIPGLVTGKLSSDVLFLASFGGALTLFFIIVSGLKHMISSAKGKNYEASSPNNDFGDEGGASE